MTGEIPWPSRKTCPSAAMSTANPTGTLLKPDRGGGIRRLPPEPWHGFAALNFST